MNEAPTKDSDIKTSQTFDGTTGKPDPTPRRIDLSNSRDIRLELASVYRRMDAGEITSQDGTRRTYVLKSIHDVIVSAGLAVRISDPGQQQLPTVSVTIAEYLEARKRVLEEY